MLPPCSAATFPYNLQCDLTSIQERYYYNTTPVVLQSKPILYCNYYVLLQIFAGDGEQFIVCMVSEAVIIPSL